MSNIAYEIESMSDFLTGMYLTVKVPDSEIDENALATIQDDCPNFILPFNYKNVNGFTQLTYKVGTYCKLQYFYGDIEYMQYVKLWRSILAPLLECKDWFMNPCSFVLNAGHIYYDKDKERVVYVYIPVRSACSGFDAFREMAADVAKNIKVSDPVLENKVLRCILSEFNPGEFLSMLMDHRESNEQITQKIIATRNESEQLAGEEPDIHSISLCDIIPETDAVKTDKPAQKQKKEKLNGGFRFFGGRGKKEETKRNGFKNTLPNLMPVQIPIEQNKVIPDHTQEVSIIPGTAGLRCVGRAGLPQHIEIDIKPGDIFTVGRFDVSVGKKRSNFEFEAKTKAVSRRHAAIERTDTSYTIIDLSSSAGTYVNDKKIPPNTPVSLETGSRVSFGNLGADYVWESS